MRRQGVLKWTLTLHTQHNLSVQNVKSELVCSMYIKLGSVRDRWAVLNILAVMN